MAAEKPVSVDSESCPTNLLEKAANENDDTGKNNNTSSDEEFREGSGSKDLSLTRTDSEVQSISPSLDGGYGWVVVACGFILEFFVEGPLSAFGVFQEYYVNERFKGKTSNSTISLVGVLSASAMAILGVVAGKLCKRFGYRIVPICGAITLSTGYLLASFAIQPWHLLLTQGVICGAGASMTFMPAVSVPAQWFDKRRGLATGIVNIGIGLGGIMWTQADHFLLKHLSVDWTLRLTAGVVLVVCVIAIILMKTRHTEGATPTTTTLSSPRTAMCILYDTNLIIYLVSSLLTGISSLIPYYYLPGYALDIGLTNSEGATIVCIANATSLVGRVLATLLSDWIGSTSILIISTSLTSSSILLIWATTQSYKGTIAFGAIYGLGYGAIFTQTATFLSKLFGLDYLPVLVGLYYTTSGMGYLLGPPIAGLVLEKTQSTKPPYIWLILYCGIPMFLACLAMIFIKLNLWRIERSTRNDHHS